MNDLDICQETQRDKAIVRKHNYNVLQVASKVPEPVQDSSEIVLAGWGL